MSIFKGGSIILLPAHGLGATVAPLAVTYANFFYYGLNTPFDVNPTRPGIVQNFSVRTTNPQPSDGTLVLIVQKIRTNTALQITIPAGAAGATFYNTLNSFSVVPGDVLTIIITNNSPTGNSSSIRDISAELIYT